MQLYVNVKVNTRAASMPTYSISELARELDITTRAIRFYEEQSMLSPERRGQERIYSSKDKVTLKLILRGKRIGVAGGPDGLGWQLLQQVAAGQGIDLARETTVQYAAPPLLSQALRRGQVDALLTFWHFSARLRGEGGVHAAFGLADLVGALGLDPDLPVLGYLFPHAWANEHDDLLQRFAKALRQTKDQLASQTEHWEEIRPLMRAENDAVFAALHHSFVEGNPQPLEGARMADLQRLLLLTGANQEKLMPAALFQSEP